VDQRHICRAGHGRDMRRRTSIGMQFRVLRKIALYLLRKTSVPEKRFGTSRKMFPERSFGGRLQRRLLTCCPVRAKLNDAALSAVQGSVI